MALVYIETYGCQMNEYDSELVKTILKDAGHHIIPSLASADVILLNTCAVRENAYNKIYGRVGDLKFYRDSRKTRIGILGCMAQNLKDSLLEKNKNVDFIVGPDNYKQLPQLISDSLANQTLHSSIADLSEFETYSDIAPSRNDGPNAWIAIMRGCDNFCTFCVVPYTRGRERSRTMESILAEARESVSAGKKQITLLGQNVNSYNSEGKRFTDLMDAIAGIEGLERVRFTSPHPLDFPEELLRVIARHPNLCKQIHLPLQSGNNEVLRRMNRGYTREQYLEIAAMVRDILPQAHISTDIIVGFPGETHEQFLETRDVMEKVRFETSYIFKYSPREGTLAMKKFPDDVSAQDKTTRIVDLNELQNSLTLQSLAAMVGMEVDVLVEYETTALSDQQCQGRIEQGVIVVLPQSGDIRVGQTLSVKIMRHTSHVLIGEPVAALVHA